MVETEGFEPSVELLAPHTISNRAPSASRSRLQKKNVFIKTIKKRKKKGGGGGIRTHGTSRYGGFQNRFLRPLGHTSNIVEMPFIVIRLYGQALPCRVVELLVPAHCRQPVDSSPI
jgi:hypothetical protein